MFVKEASFISMKNKFFTKKKIIIFSIIALIIAGGIIYFASSGKSKTSYVTDVVQRKDLLQTVSEVGTVESPSQIDLNFSNPGKLAVKSVAVGDSIKMGEVLAQLDYQALTISQAQATATLSSAQDSLTKLLQGATSAQIAVSQAQVNQASASAASAADNLNNVKASTAESIRQAQSNLDDLQGLTTTVTTYQQTVVSAQTALDNAKASNQKTIDNTTINLLNDVGGKLSLGVTALDSINTITTDDSIKDFLGSKNKGYLVSVKAEYVTAEVLMATANQSLSVANAGNNQVNIDQAASDSLACLKKISDSLNDLYNALVNSSITNQIVLNTDKTNINAQIASINSAINIVSMDQQNFDNAYLAYNTNVSAAQNSLSSAQAAWNNAIVSAKNILSSAKVNGNQQVSAAQNAVEAANQALAVAQKQLAQLKSPPRQEDINLAQAQVNSAQAALDQVNNQINNDIIKSPIDGQIVKDNYTVGEQTSLGMPVFSVLAQNDLEISVDISESDIVKVKQNDAVEITLDAFGPDQKFNGIAYFIDPAATVIQDVTYYRVKIRFTDAPELVAQIKPGMTANVTIIADKRSGVITVPERAVISKVNGDKVVRILNKNVLTEVPIKVGLRGDDGSIEITQGNLTVGETIVVFINTK